MAATFQLRISGGLITRQIVAPRRGSFAAYSHHCGRADNQDGLLVRTGPSKVLAVADGLGGIPGGAAASRIALEKLDQELSRGTMLGIAFEEAHRAVINAAAADPRYPQMGTTLVAAEVAEDQVDVRSCGDSRAYLIKQDGSIGLLTIDQTTASSVYLQSLPTLSLPLWEVAHYSDYLQSYPQFGFLTSYLGSANFNVFSSITGLARGDRLLLCSDGLHNYLPHAAVAEILAGRAPLVETITRLVDSSYQQMIAAIQAGGIGDNFTAIMYEH